MDAVFMDKLTELNEIEIKKSKVLAVIFQKTTQKLMDRKIQSLENNFEEQAQFYAQRLEDYDDIYQEIVNQYKEQLSEVVAKYNELYINMYLELQEAECNQKIAITNLKRSYDTKQELFNRANQAKLEEYDRKVRACLQKKINYDIIIEKCEEELNQCVIQVEKEMNSLFANQSGQLSLNQDGMFRTFIHKIKNIFQGKARFNTYVIEPIQIELEMIDRKIPDIMDEIEQKMILFVAKMKQAKAETNQIFDQMI